MSAEIEKWRKYIRNGATLETLHNYWRDNHVVWIKRKRNGDIVVALDGRNYSLPDAVAKIRGVPATNPGKSMAKRKQAKNPAPIIPKNVLALALKHHVNVRRDEFGVFTIWKGDSPKVYAQSPTGAIKRVWQIVEHVGVERGVKKNPAKKRPERIIRSEYGAHHALRDSKPKSYFEHYAAKTLKRAAKKNPRRKGYCVYAVHNSNLYYWSGMAFSITAKPVVYPTKEAAEVTAYRLLREFQTQLRGWSVDVRPA